MKLKLLFGAVNTVALFAACSVAAQNYQQMPVSSGFTADVIANGVGSSTVSTNNDVDGAGYAFVARDFQLTSSSAALTYGIPVNGLITSAVAATPGLSYQLASLSANNSLRLTAVNDTGTLTFTTPKAATKLYMLAVSGSGASTVTAVVNFSDGTSQTFTGISIADWYNATNFAIQGIGRVKKPGATPATADDVPSPEGGTNPRLYQFEMAIDAANQAKTIQSVAVTKTAGPGIPNVFAFSADAYSTCAPPVLQAPASITANSALVSWTAPSSSVVSYDVYHSTSNTTPANTATPTYPGVTGTSTTIGGLTSNTNYYYWVRTNCSTATSQSVWSFAGTFKTACSTFTVPYTENFDTTTTGSSTNNNAPSCWSYLESASFAGYGYVIASTPYSTPNSYYLYNSSGLTGGQMLVTPPTVSLSDGTKRVRFYARASSGTTTTLSVGTLSNPTDPASFTQIGSPLALTTTYGMYTVNIPAGSDLQLALKHGMAAINQGIYIDNITVQAIPSCLEPTAITTSNLTTTSVTVNWTAPSPVPANGYNVYYSTSSTPPTSATVLDATNSVSATGTSATIMNLTPDTNYYIFVRSKCSGSDNSIWTDAVTVRTGYCVPSSSNQNSWVSAFSSTGAVTNMAYTSSAGAAGGYQNLTSSNNKISTTAGASTSVSFTAGGPTCGFAVWIDWNNNFTFETTERVFVTSTYVTSTSGTITVPAGTAAGTYRMRVVTDYNSTAPANACASITRGEFIDFKFEVASALATAETSVNKNEIKVYPNPFTDVLYIAQTKGVRSVSVADVSGRVVKTIENPGNELHLGELNSGLYLVTVTYSDGTSSTAKAIKK
ncbi:fibronectin type III domain-containing protein [uncultured Chryseobacterium sp.]|uniref:GEVED domain-containing protein n=1 Tax=uncultured Chryseobacterium sp. TaxID=259322 RepID=UPI0025E213FE|nr:fibronectin type III domain-containing protein [uncultured Chryseobacterium sp.]